MIVENDPPRKRPYLLLPRVNGTTGIAAAAEGGAMRHSAAAGESPTLMVGLALREVAAPSGAAVLPAPAAAQPVEVGARWTAAAEDARPVAAEAWPPAVEPAREETVAESEPAAYGEPTRVEVEQASAAEARATRGDRRRPTALELLAAVVPSAAGALVAYYLVDGRSADPVAWSALGAAGGILLGWGCLLWMRRSRRG